MSFSSAGRILASHLMLMFLSALAPAQPFGYADFVFQKLNNGRWQGSSTGPTAIFQTANFTVSPAESIVSGSWRRGFTPAAVWAGIEIDSAYTDSTIEIEIYEEGFGVLRSQHGWFAISGWSQSALEMRFQVDTSQEVQPSDLDHDIIERADSILHVESVWNRSDNRLCDPKAATWSIYCAMEMATIQVTGGFHHRRPALQLIRRIVEERTVGRKYRHRLMEYNNDPSTTFEDIVGVFSEGLARIPY